MRRRPAARPPAAALPPPPACASQGDSITLKVNKLMSVKNLPYEYYSLPYCRPDKIVSSAENLGEVLRGDRIENSAYEVGAGGWKSGEASSGQKECLAGQRARSGGPAAAGHRAARRRPYGRLAWLPTAAPVLRCAPLQTSFRVDQHCSILCRIGALNKAQVKAFTSKISDEYRVNMCACVCVGGGGGGVEGRSCSCAAWRVAAGRPHVHGTAALRLAPIQPLLQPTNTPPRPHARHRILDNLPIGMVRMRDDDGEQVKTYERGFPVGAMDVRAALHPGAAPRAAGACWG